MTVLGNIVAVTSIIAVVSLIQGLNASVKQAILNQAGADSFNIQQFPVTRSDEEFDKVRSNPRITLQRRARDPALRRRADRRGHGRLQAAAAASPIATSRSTTRSVQGVTAEYVNFSELRRRARPADEPDRSRHGRGRSTVHRLADRRPAVRRSDRSDRQDHPDRGRALPRRRRQREEGLAARPVAGRVRGHPARAVPDDVRIAPVAVADRQAARPLADRRGAWTRRPSRCAARGA